VGQDPLSRRRFLAGSAALLAGGALVAVPGVAKAHITGSPTDIDMLNFALTLEHLEYAFYRDGLQKFSAQDIKNSRFLQGDAKRFIRSSAYRYLQLIREHEDIHVDTLTSVIKSLGGEPVPEATYNFEQTAFTSTQEFLKVARLLENTGVTAYDGRSPTSRLRSS
jgi:rubrerythrin